jgi:hypothetical protein
MSTNEYQRLGSAEAQISCSIHTLHSISNSYTVHNFSSFFSCTEEEREQVLYPKVCSNRDSWTETTGKHHGQPSSLLQKGSKSPAILLCGSLYLTPLIFFQVSSHRSSALSQMVFLSEFSRPQADWLHLEHRGQGGEVVLHAMTSDWILSIDQLCCLTQRERLRHVPDYMSNRVVTNLEETDLEPFIWT